MRTGRLTQHPSRLALGGVAALLLLLGAGCGGGDDDDASDTSRGRVHRPRPAKHQRRGHRGHRRLRLR
ncbi:MAG: hypothetical protein U5R31_13775 [Acidimicrobiia bacterium]|nr:hypothetical protein [Acidimicrobiia bacterium]